MPFIIIISITLNSAVGLKVENSKKTIHRVPLFLWVAVFTGLLFIALYQPKNYFNDPTSTVLYASNGDLLAATVAADGQYRFPMADSIPWKFNRCILTFEDRYFYMHPGINPFSLARAAWQNLREGRIVSGGSTITMQVARLKRKGKSRTFYEKAMEMLMAIRLELNFSKKHILSLYASNAPYGGNVVGIEAAAWRYYGRTAHELSWAESAALAVLPNSPALVFPGRNPFALENKRNNLLKKLYQQGDIDSITYVLSLLEPLPQKPTPLPLLAPHLLTRSISDGKKGEDVRTTINRFLQVRSMEILERHRLRLSGNQIHNAALLIVEVETGNALAYVGNMPGSEFGGDVDIITSPRSTGSILKPFLYAAMLHQGKILPNSLVPDIPTQIGNFTPKNFYPVYDGAVPASRALSRSLNVPAVRMLYQYGVAPFHHLLKGLGLTTITRSADNYGLSLILGGAEATLWDLAGVYAGMARTLNHFRKLESRYDKSDYRAPAYVKSTKESPRQLIQFHSILDASAIYFTFDAMRNVARPDELVGWRYFASSRSVAWKTGTSFGHRDAWAIGLNPRYVVAVWVGNASGEGRPNLTGISAAAPILFDVFEMLPPSPWFEMPVDDMARVAICRYSGHRASPICEPVDTVWIPMKGLETTACPYHRIVHLNPEKIFRVTDRCMSVSEMVLESWFILPPAMEWFYKSKNPHYSVLPPYEKGCEPEQESAPMALLYPRVSGVTITIPRDLDGKPGEAVFEAAHRIDGTTIYWHLDGEYMGATKSFHRMAFNPGAGLHRLTLVDGEGNMLEVTFRIE
ncbi:MAG TPA: penicillin-binding protein 1C [Tenuifilaceae bacterium]|nr:penicillin-binding protein 1C [Tenuifilaceae bacterium]